MKIRIILILFILFSLNVNCSAITAHTPTTTTVHLQKSQNVEDSISNVVYSFFAGLFKNLSGQSNGSIIKSENITQLSDTMQKYQDEEIKNNPAYEQSHAKDKTDFGIGLLNFIANILKFFGV